VGGERESKICLSGAAENTERVFKALSGTDKIQGILKIRATSRFSQRALLERSVSLSSLNVTHQNSCISLSHLKKSNPNTITNLYRSPKGRGMIQIDCVAGYQSKRTAAVGLRFSQ